MAYIQASIIDADQIALQNRKLMNLSLALPSSR